MDMGPATTALQGKGLGCQQPDYFQDMAHVNGTRITKSLSSSV